jgi:hypothetical protein
LGSNPKKLVLMNENQLYAAARERLAALEAEREELRAFLRTYERLAVDAVKAAETKPHRWSASAIVDVAMQVLTDNGAPMKLGALFDAVVARGVQIGGKNPRNNFGAMLSLEKTRLTTGREGWYFKDEYPRQLDGDEYDEGPAMETARPCLSNGAAVQPA